MYESKVDSLQVLKKYEAVIKQFAIEEKGFSLVHTDDAIVVKILRDMFSAHLHLRGDYLRFAAHDKELFKEAKRVYEAKGKALFWVFRVFSG